MPILRTDGLVRRFGSLMAVNQLSLSVEKDEIIGLIGPNGAGKTTLLNCIAGADRPSAGTVWFDGMDTTGRSADFMCRLGLSRTFQIPQPFPKLTAFENVMASAIFGNPHRRRSQAAEAAAGALDLVEFPRAGDTPAMELNTVQLKRLDLARALASQPRLLLLDELGAGLTPGELEALMGIILRVRENGVTIVVVEHVMQVIRGLCDRVVVMQYGEKIAEGPMSEVANDPRVVDAYLGNICA